MPAWQRHTGMERCRYWKSQRFSSDECLNRLASLFSMKIQAHGHVKAWGFVGSPVKRYLGLEDVNPESMILVVCLGQLTLLNRYRVSSNERCRVVDSHAC